MIPGGHITERRDVSVYGGRASFDLEARDQSITTIRLFTQPYLQYLRS